MRKDEIMERLYQLMLNYIHQHSLLERNIIFLCHYLPYITFGLYPCLLIYLFFIKSDLLLITIIKPLSAFLFVTLFRKIINRKRPYETMQILYLNTNQANPFQVDIQ